MDSSLQPFFRPAGVVVIGASQDEAKLGHGVARNLAECGYQGAVYYVNPRGGELFGRPLYQSVHEVPDPVDLAVVITPAGEVPATLRACGERGLRGALIISGGFGETGPQGAELERVCLNVAQEFGMRLVGPNCVGWLDTHLPLDTTFLPFGRPVAGPVAFISHSGALSVAVLDWAWAHGFGLSLLLSLGNQVDVGECDVLEAVAADRYTQVLMLYLEGIRDGRRFVSAARRITAGKPIVALKVGRSQSGQAAVASHTGALAGSEAAFDAAFRRAGVLRAQTSEEMFDWARGLAWCPLPAGRQVAVLTSSGGPGVLAVDALEAQGMVIAGLQPATRQGLADLLPAAASLRNPVDMLASATPDQFASCLRLLLDDPGVDSVLVISLLPPIHTTESIAEALIPIIQTARKPVVVALLGGMFIDRAEAVYQAAQVATYPFPERAAGVLAMLARRADFLRKRRTDFLRKQRTENAGGQDESPAASDVQRARAQALLATAGPDLPSPSQGAQFLDTQTVQALLDAYGIPVLPTYLAATPDQAVAFAAQAGYPVALKVASADVAHKSDSGGVLLNLADEREVRSGFRSIMHNVTAALPAARIDGVSVQAMAPAGQEVITGVVQDRQFGPLVMFGSGGVEVEGLRDVAFELAPLSAADAMHMLEQTWAGRRLAGFRHLPPADRDAVVNVLIRLGQLAADFPQIAELEINPLCVFPTGAGALAVDMRMAIIHSPRPEGPAVTCP